MRFFKLIRTGLILLLVAFLTQQYFFPQPDVRGPFSQGAFPPGPVLVFAPHSDDESLAAGGLLQQAEAAGHNARVVLVTGGDGFPVAAQAHFHHGQLSPEQMIAFGRLRLGESRAALAALGLPPERLTFLGFADRSLDRLWQECWREEAPCQSPFTKRTAVPYAEAFEPGAPLAGERLLAQLITILKQARPAVVAYPHPNEAHVDHWGLSNFVAAALAHLARTEPGWQAPAEWLYLIHRGDWPAPKGLRPTSHLTPPGALVGGMTEWHVPALSPEQVGAKSTAIEAYRSQVPILGRFMHSFVRANELFGTVAPVDLTKPGGATLTGPPGPDPWVQAITDPQGDTVARKVERGADLTAVWAAKGPAELAVALRLAAPLSSRAHLRLYVRPWQGSWGELAEVHLERSAPPEVKRWPDRSAPSEWKGYLNSGQEGSWVTARIRLDRLGQPGAVMLAAETWIDGALIDRTAWRVVSLDGR